MARAKIPKNRPFYIYKSSIVNKLQQIDADRDATNRVLRMENHFRRKIQTLSDNLPLTDSKLESLWTNPFVLMSHSFHNGYTHIHQIEKDILIGKVFSFIETSVGKMVEEVVLPVYSWDLVPSQMQTPYSIIDGELISGNTAEFATLKSGPRCINDSMVSGISGAIVEYYSFWANDKNVDKINFTVGILYGTYKKSQKKDWHILDEVRKSLRKKGINMRVPPDYRWDCSFSDGKISTNITVKIGVDLWSYIGRSDKSFLEICIAIVRACVPPSTTTPEDYSYTISNLKAITSLGLLPEDFNVGILQKSQLEWLFLVTSHFCDELVNR